MSEWRQCTIGELIDEGVILIHKDGNHGANYPRVGDFGSTGRPFLTAKSIGDWNIDLQGSPRLSEVKAQSLRFGFVRPGDVLLSHNATVGRVAIVPNTQEKPVIGTSLTQFRVDPRKLLPGFLALCFTGRDFQNQLSFVMAQTTRNQVPITNQRLLELHIPPIPTQREIVDVIFSLLNKIDLNRRMNETLETLARAIFKDWFVDFGPTKAKMERREAYLSADMWLLFPDRLDDEGKPFGWSTTKLACLAHLNRDIVQPTAQANELFDHHSIPAYDSGKSSVRELGRVILSNKNVIPAHSVLLSKLNPEIERVWFVDIDCQIRAICSTEFLVLQPREIRDRAFLYCFLVSQDVRQRLQSMTTGTSKSHQRVQPESVMALPLITATQPLHKVFADRVTPMLESICQRRRESDALAAIRNLLLPKLMSGEIRIKDIENVLEDVL